MPFKNTARARGLRTTLVTSLSIVALACFAGGAQAASETVDETFPASVTAAGTYADTGTGQPVSISDDGRYVAFVSKAANLSGEAPAGVWEAYVKDLETGEVRLVSRADGEAGDPAEASPSGLQPFTEIESATISGDGRYVLFTSRADNLVEGLPLAEEAAEEWFSTHVYRRDLQSGETVLVDRVDGVGGPTLSAEAEGQAISDDGRYVVFQAEIEDLDDAAGEHEWAESGTLYVRDTQAGTTTVVSRASGAGGEVADGPSFGNAVSSDGRYVSFESSASNLAPGMGSNHVYQVYLRELQPPFETTLVSQSSSAVAGDGDSFESVFVDSAGCEVGFTSAATNLTGVEPPIFGGYLRSRCSIPPSAELISLDGEGAPFEEGSLADAAGDGRRVLVKGGQHLYLSDLETGLTTLVDRASGPQGAPSNGFGAEQGAISANGCRVAFISQATNLTANEPPPGGGSQPQQVFVRQLAKCKPTVEEKAEAGKRGDHGDDRGASPSTIRSPTKLKIGRLSRGSLRLEFSDAGWATVRIRRLVDGRPRRWRFLKTLVAEASGAERVEVGLSDLPPGRYRLAIRLREPHSRGLVRFLAVEP